MASTIKDVAKMADVSISTVSRVINDSKPVSPEARRKVIHAIDVLDYKPNEVARSLVTKKSNLIGIIVDDIGSSYVSQILRGVEEVGRMYNYDILLSSSYGDSEIELKFAKLFSQKQVEGIIVISHKLNQKLMYKLEELKIPYVNMNKFYNLEDSLTIGIDYENVSSNMVSYLYEIGHRRIASLVMKKDIDRTEEKLKLNGYEKVMEKNNLEKFELFTEGIGEKDVEAISDEIIKAVKEDNVTAFFCSQDELAIYTINTLLDNGIKVPEEVSVTGFGGNKLTSIYRPKLTTVKIPFYDIGAVAIRTILKEIKNEEVKETKEEDIILPVQISKEDSTREI